MPYVFAALPQISASASLSRHLCCWRFPCSPHCCCCCYCYCRWVPCLCLRMLMVRLGCRQPWCVTLFVALATPPAHLRDVGLGCSACEALQLDPSNQGFSLACQEASSSLLPAPVAQLVPLAAPVAAAGAGGGRGGAGRRPGGPPVARDLQQPNNFNYTHPAEPRRIKKDE